MAKMISMAVNIVSPQYFHAISHFIPKKKRGGGGAFKKGHLPDLLILKPAKLHKLTVLAILVYISR